MRVFQLTPGSSILILPTLAALSVPPGQAQSILVVAMPYAANDSKVNP